MKHCLVLLLLITSFSPLTAQTVSTEVAALRQQIDQAPADTSKVWLIEQLFFQLYREQQVDQLYATAEEGLQLAQVLNDPRCQAKMNYYVAMALQATGEAAAAINAFQEALRFLEQYKDPVLTAKIHVNQGVAHHRLGDWNAALQSYLTAHTIYEKTDEKAAHARLLNNIGVLYKSREKYERAQEIYQQSYDLKAELNDSVGMAISLMNIGLLYKERKEQEDEGIAYLQRSLALFEALGRASGIASCKASIGIAYVQLEKWVKAQATLQQAWDYYQDHIDHEYTIPILYGLGEVAKHRRSFVEAEQFYEQGLTYARELQQKRQVFSLLEGLGPVKAQLGKYQEGLQITQEALMLKDTLKEASKLKALEELQVQFDVQQKENELKISELELVKRTQQRNLLWGSLAFIILLGGGVFWNFQTTAKTNERLAQQEINLQQQRIQQLEQDKQLASLNAMLQGQEKERVRIANDLHDGLGGLLSAVKSYFHAFAENLPTTPNAQKASTLIDQASTEVRRIAHNLTPQALRLAGLPAALEDLALHIRHKGLTCDLELLGLEDTDFPAAKASNIYRIIQELTHNAVKHAQATHLLIQLIHQANNTTILVEDDGTGFDVDVALQQEGLGLASVNARVAFLQGQIHWDSVIGEGTTVSIEL